MRYRQGLAPEQFLTSYHFGTPTGVLSEHLAIFVEQGGTARPAASGSGGEWAVLPDGKAYPVLCSDLVPIVTEDGPSDTRCGLPAVGEYGSCEGHTSERLHWLDMSQAEQVYMERMEGAL